MLAPAPLPSAVPYHAVFSPCGLHRYAWSYRWADGPTVLFIGLNPSKANGGRTDATVRHCIGFAKRWGYGAIRIGNLFSWVDTDPTTMMAVAEPVGPDCDMHLRLLAEDADLIVAVWGVHGSHLGRDAAVKQMFRGRLHAIEVNKDGSPSHPLYLPKYLDPTPYA